MFVSIVLKVTWIYFKSIEYLIRTSMVKKKKKKKARPFT